ncbi:MAG TPA: hypothetical protein VIV60_35760 [Polyangiaceae bacterium]
MPLRSPTQVHAANLDSLANPQGSVLEPGEFILDVRRTAAPTPSVPAIGAACRGAGVAYDAIDCGDLTMNESAKPDAPIDADGYRVGPGMHVQLEYRVRDADGEAVGPDVEQLAVVFGMGQLLPAIERAIDGLSAGSQKQIKLLSRDAYGPRKPDSVLEVERDEFPSDVEAGDYFEVENAERGMLVLRVLEVESDYVLVDLNHPLAGQDLDVDVNIVRVRPAERNEIDAAMEVANRQVSEPEPALISPDSLLRGRGRR